MNFVRVFIAVALLLAVSLAGCSGPPGFESDKPHSGGGTGSGSGEDFNPDTPGGSGSDDPPASPRSAMLLRFNLQECTGVETLGFLDAALVEAALPDGYEVYVESDALGELGVPAQYVWAECGSLQTPTALVNDTVYGYTAVRIEPPANALNGDEHWYRLRMLAQEDVLAALWVAAGYEVSSGRYSDVSLGSDPIFAGVVPESREVTLGDYVARGAVTAAFSDVPVQVAHYTEVAEGRLEWTGSFDAAAFRGMAGMIEVPSDDPLASAWGAQVMPPNQRYLDDAQWLGNDLWLRLPAEIP